MPARLATRQRLVSLVRWLPQVLTVGTVITGSVFLYAWATKPYQVRYFQQSDDEGSRVSVYAAADTGAPLLISITCSGTGLNDITFRPVLEKSRDWSLREMLPSVPDAAKPIGGSFDELSELADPHLPGGLSKWQELEESEIASRVKSMLATKPYRGIPMSAKVEFANGFAGLGMEGEHQRAVQLRLGFPLNADKEKTLREKLDPLLQEWENQSTTVVNAWLQRWQSLTGTSLVPTRVGIGRSTPVYLSAPALKRGTGLVVGVNHDSSTAPQFGVTLGDNSAYRVDDESELSKPSILFAFRGYPWAFFALIVVVALVFAVFVSYWRWPKHLAGPRLFELAQSDDEDELWGELRSRNAWADTYIVNAFFVRGASFTPSEIVVAYFWRTLRDTLLAHRVSASTDQEVEEALHLLLDRAILNAIP